MGNKDIKILCYGDDAVLIAENEDGLQRLLFKFNTTAKSLKMKISAAKIKCMITSKTPISCKLVVDDEIIQQEMKFKYSGPDISGSVDVGVEVRNQAAKAARTSTYLNDTIFRNKYIVIESKSRIYKTVIRPILTYTAETKPDTSNTKRILETTQNKIVRSIAGKTLFDRRQREARKLEEHVRLTT
ncbi:uncharacterized protein LOC130898078 [Diorhabda carinulata]|uniref:uncharacterized protein LOC130898078 n=1 Tax=Diorhabda carinulata TaxID=1163345 RepID=UPI0025A2FC4A|nr:uncharacterized protein LOC130898078 [Diorhabda carinulata]